jgi:hypothetical protein
MARAVAARAKTTKAAASSKILETHRLLSLLGAV